MPLFRKTKNVFGPGHCSFTTSPDGKEDWIIYHRAKHSNAQWDRQVHAQKFTWNKNDLPIFGSAVGSDNEILLPSGEYEIITQIN